MKRGTLKINGKFGWNKWAVSQRNVPLNERLKLSQVKGYIWSKVDLTDEGQGGTRTLSTLFGTFPRKKLLFIAIK